MQETDQMPRMAQYILVVLACVWLHQPADAAVLAKIVPPKASGAELGLRTSAPAASAISAANAATVTADSA